MPVLALLNTRDAEAGTDALDSAEGVTAFTREHGLPRLAPGDVPSLLRLREALRAARLRPDGDPADLNALLAQAPLTVRLTASGTPRLVPAPGLAPFAELTARLAAGIAAAQAEGTWERLKVCPAENCAWAFYDQSPAGRRRWCSMRVCGARAKMRSYRARRRGTGGTGAPARPA